MNQTAVLRKHSSLKVWTTVPPTCRCLTVFTSQLISLVIQRTSAPWVKPQNMKEFPHSDSSTCWTVNQRNEQTSCGQTSGVWPQSLRIIFAQFVCELPNSCEIPRIKKLIIWPANIRQCCGWSINSRQDSSHMEYKGLKTGSCAPDNICITNRSLAGSSCFLHTLSSRPWAQSTRSSSWT